jgi:large subunit ribosomal protein L17
MRHRNKTNGLGRTASHRKAMLANMASSLITNKRIKTTLAKAKVLRTYIEPIITKSKNDSTANRRLAFRYLRDKYAVSELFRNVAPKIADRPGGYTRILKLGHRVGDNAEICIIELVDFNTTYNPKKKSTSKKRRSRRGSSKKSTTQNNVATENQQTEQAEQPAETTDQNPDTTQQTAETIENKEQQTNSTENINKTEQTEQAEKTEKTEQENKDENKE